jgi:hypothetical protein
MRDISCFSSASVGECWDIALKYVTTAFDNQNKNVNSQIQDNLIYI